MNISSEQDSFVNYLSFEKRFSNHTIAAYSRDISRFADYCREVCSISDFSEINSSIIRSWIVSLMENKLAARTANRKISSLKSFYKYLLRKGTISVNPMNRIQSPKTSKKLPVFVEQDKMMLLLDNIDFGNNFEGHRNKLIIEMLYGTGMRLSELINLKKADVDLYNSQLKVIGKRNKERIIPFNRELTVTIKTYLEMPELKGSGKSENFFQTAAGKKLYAKLVYRVVRSYLSRVTTIEKRSPHVLRHSFATHMLNNGADLNSIKELLGHANLAATQIYTHNTVEKLKNIHKQAHPKA